MTLVLSLLLACGPKAAPQPVAAAAAEAAPSGASLDGAKLPGDAASRSFAKRLVTTPIVDFSPTEGGGIAFTWTRVTFGGDNAWRAEGRMRDPEGETVSCTESGTWELEPAESEGVAIVALAQAQGDCPGRPSTGTARYRLLAEGDGWKVQVR
jgi:hypothetical protein